MVTILNNDIQEQINLKVTRAKQVIKYCNSKNGFYASFNTYFAQYWLRDLVYCIDPVLNLGYTEFVSKHLLLFIRNQKKDGNIPVRIFDIPKIPFLVGKLLSDPPIIDIHTIRKGGYYPTVDSPLLLASALVNNRSIIEKQTNKIVIETALNRIKQFLKETTNNEHRFIKGSDWRDAMHNYENKYLFSNQILLYTARKSLGENNIAQDLKKEINRVLWNEKLGYYQDHLQSDVFDSLGHALALLNGIVPKDKTDSIIHNFEKGSTKYGYRNLWPPYHPKICGRKKDTYQNGGIWPFVDGHIILALI
jgi:glycogen debranching enzyme